MYPLFFSNSEQILYIVNVLLQMFMISYVFKTNYKLYGLRWFLNDQEDQLDEQKFLENTVFPKVTMCDIWVRVLGNNQRWEGSEFYIFII